MQIPFSPCTILLSLPSGFALHISFLIETTQIGSTTVVGWRCRRRKKLVLRRILVDSRAEGKILVKCRTDDVVDGFRTEVQTSQEGLSCVGTVGRITLDGWSGEQTRIENPVSCIIQQDSIRLSHSSIAQVDKHGLVQPNVRRRYLPHHTSSLLNKLAKIHLLI
jgi:hypothetical protein